MEAIHTRPFRGATAFVLALRPGVAALVSPLCDRFVCAPQFVRAPSSTEHGSSSSSSSGGGGGNGLSDGDGGVGTGEPPGAASLVIPLDPSTVTCLVLQHFASWAAFQQRGSSGYKFHVETGLSHRRQRKGVAWRVRFADGRNESADDGGGGDTGDGDDNEDDQQAASSFGSLFVEDGDDEGGSGGADY